MVIHTQTYQKEKKPQNGNVQKSTNNHGSLKDELRRLLAELLGTFALTLVAAGGDVIATISGGAVSPAARVVAPGLLVMAMIYTLVGHLPYATGICDAEQKRQEGAKSCHVQHRSP
jgi:glycerol uptake facilitator-like aquaporin